MFGVTHYGLDVELLPSPIASVIPDAPGRIRCTCALDLAAAGEPVRCADFILYRLLHVSSATDGAGTPLVLRQSLHAVDGLGDLQVSAVEVEFPVPIAPGERRTLRLSYEGPLVGYREVMPYVHDAVLRDVAVLRPEILRGICFGPPTGATGARLRGALHDSSARTAGRGIRVCVMAGQRMLEDGNRDLGDGALEIRPLLGGMRVQAVTMSSTEGGAGNGCMAGASGEAPCVWARRRRCSVAPDGRQPP